MRFKLKLEVLPEIKGRAIPINYQYELSSAIYKIIANSDVKYSQWLHDNGFDSKNKIFKLFSFSRLIIPQYRIDKERERLIIHSNVVEWYVSFLPEKSTKLFIQGLFEDQIIEISDSVSGAVFQVREVQLMPDLGDVMKTEFETISPICISHRNDNGKIDYLSPEMLNYKDGLLTGLLSRYRALYGLDYKESVYIDFQLIGKAKPVLVKIKANTPAQTFVKGYIYRFKLSLPDKLMQIAYHSGLGEKCSMGFGMIK